MKIAAVICCLFLCSFAMGQRKLDFKSVVLGEYNYDYTPENCNYYYEQAKSLLEIKNPDSLLRASKIMWGLLIYDTLKYSVEHFEPFLKKLIQSNKQYYGDMLKGTWRFNYQYVDGFGSAPYDSTRKDTLRTVTFDGTNAYFYFKDSLYKKTSYSIEQYQDGFLFTRVNIYNICFNDYEDTWWLDLFKPYRMAIKHYFPCVCGCMEYVYKKISDNPLLIADTK